MAAPKIEQPIFTKSEFTLILDGLEMAINSNRRAQNTGKNPQLIAVYVSLQADLINLRDKIKLVLPYV